MAGTTHLCNINNNNNVTNNWEDLYKVYPEPDSIKEVEAGKSLRPI